ncbi:pyridoxine/pyridoxamine 5'-phosphate oxidase isoform X1 [Anthonomus grandis grandis]|uniref:pyridoxine/pyridoxamine 5'-phosphate oxidase isoform X1 n=1 Tax=Anthonomus grandis grandis TaxID=2921223 RepID=UPI0021661C32|nr:pyridoxine/pyridoxamine 5'-phosphate oxidase isoform X1 [Anthonomus grandis grandis]
MTSRLAKIDVPKQWGPFELFQNWMAEFTSITKLPVFLNLATASSDGYVKNRFVELQELANDGILFNTCDNSPKVKQLTENPKAAASFLFQYVRNNTEPVSRQVRIEGIAERIPGKMEENTFYAEPLYAQIRSVLIKDQSMEVNWDELKNQHDEMLAKVKSGEITLSPPENLVVYKIVPTTFDFYHSGENEIADRVLFTQETSGLWKHCHITA